MIASAEENKEKNKPSFFECERYVSPICRERLDPLFYAYFKLGFYRCVDYLFDGIKREVRVVYLDSPIFGDGPVSELHATKDEQRGVCVLVECDEDEGEIFKRIKNEEERRNFLYLDYIYFSDLKKLVEEPEQTEERFYNLIFYFLTEKIDD